MGARRRIAVTGQGFRGLLLAASLLLSLAAWAGDDDKLPLWRLAGNSNTVYLLGSVHLLRASDYPLPDAITAAYDDAEQLVMELDMDDIDPGAAAALTRELGVIRGDGGLAMLLGDDAFREAAQLAAAAGIPLDALSASEPWLAAITVEQLALTRIGFDARHGVEAHLAGRALEDGKPITGLETLEQQLRMLDGLPQDVQRTLLLDTLRESVHISSVMEELIRAWRSGDMDALESGMLEDLRKHPVLHRAIVVERNRDWLTQLEALLDDEDDYLVVVGALHLVGREGLPAMLGARDHDIVQLRDRESR